MLAACLLGGLRRILGTPLAPAAGWVSPEGARGAGSAWRLSLGQARSGTEYGPVTDLPDWSFADGRPSPPLKGQIRRQQQAEAMARRIVMLTNELDRGMERWQAQQAALCRQREERQLNQPRLKGAKQRARARAPGGSGHNFGKIK
ncbi:39S ribosomal protein L52, mitochondrial [Hemiscyllium ocellatum]|uniref:39S ribosomal protein L52, mitochondrial n=1 Tax=Hemiscyllium ocellatum TaxID=170820 RepID=UPI0029674112|nr:39S ribosomal protein L52, mitochondrial [Hemiscyllium ocellatum]